MAENTAVFHVLAVYRTVALHTAVYRLYRYTAQHYCKVINKWVRNFLQKIATCQTWN